MPTQGLYLTSQANLCKLVFTDTILTLDAAVLNGIFVGVVPFDDQAEPGKQAGFLLAALGRKSRAEQAVLWGHLRSYNGDVNSLSARPIRSGMRIVMSRHVMPLVDVTHWHFQRLFKHVDPLPAALVDLVRSSPISSIEDLQLLLFSDSLDQEEEGSPAPGGHRSPRSLSAQPAQQALCKVRTEVVEVTRDMLGRSNAHFLLWPPCVEVQRCSGCCNANSLQCVPVLTHTRYLQVMKIQYINQKPNYTKAVVSVVDHVECRCQLAPRPPAPRPPVPKKKTPRRGQLPNKDQARHTPRRCCIARTSSRRTRGTTWRSCWNSTGAPEETPSPRQEEEQQHYSLAGGGGATRPGETVLHTPRWVHNASMLLEADDGTGIRGEGAGRRNHTLSPLDVPGGGGVKRVDGVLEPSLSLNGSDERARVDWGQQKSVDMHRETRRGESSSVPGGDASDHGGGSGIRHRPTKEPNPDPPGPGGRGANHTPEEERRLRMQEERVEEERRELLLLHKRLDQEKELIRLQQLKQEEEREQEKARGQQHHLHHKQHYHLQTTTQKIVTTSPATTRTPAAPDRPQAPVRPNQRRRRLKKNRKQISKAAMRAMLM
ncbi:Platelet-derived growth factor subunit B [Merluccius polli]|uniref:Platelet-derived growth factor subunit B n=1 Tax=Merluccius polli TaxID=89951 RepID=A0AA47M526_MERPO|nr:Platelet-derived growth factor subunit B [Merluccius polli]